MVEGWAADQGRWLAARGVHLLRPEESLRRGENRREKIARVGELYDVREESCSLFELSDLSGGGAVEAGVRQVDRQVETLGSRV